MADIERRRRNILTGNDIVSVADWIEHGINLISKYSEIVRKQKELTPDSLQSIRGYKDFERRPDIHPLVWMKPDVLTRCHGKNHILGGIKAPSGGGKDTMLDICRAQQDDLVAQSSDNRLFNVVVTHTGRPPRRNQMGHPIEFDGKTYHFVTHEQFKSLLTQDAFIEHVVQGEHPYGTSKTALREALNESVPISIWRGECIGWDKLAPWIIHTYPDDISPVSVITVPRVSLGTLNAWIIQKRGTAEALSWRIPRAFLDIIAGGEADIFIENPVEKNGPLQSSEALWQVLQTLHTAQTTLMK